MAKVSVIIPVYGVEKYLRKCLDSIVGQTFRDLEILLIDDGSPDGCGRICDAYAGKDNRIRVLHKKNEGLPAARNDGIRLATGDWLLFVDADDWCDIRYIENLYGQGGTGCDVITAASWKEEKDHTFVRQRIFCAAGEYGGEDILSYAQGKTIWWGEISREQPACFAPDGGLGAPWDKLYKREIVLREHLRFDRDARALEDKLFNLLYFEKVKRIQYVDEPGYFYRRVEESITKKFDQDRLRKDGYYHRKVYEYAKHSDHEEILMKALYLNMTATLITNLSRYFYNPAYRKPFSAKCKELKAYLDGALCHQSLCLVDRRQLSLRDRGIVFLAKRRAAFAVSVLYFGKKVLKSLMEKFLENRKGE